MPWRCAMGAITLSSVRGTRVTLPIGAERPVRTPLVSMRRAAGVAPAERELMAGAIWCFSTPTQQSAAAHPKNHFGWMLNGAELFRLLEEDYPLFDGSIVPSGTRVCFETFPQAVACALSGALVSAKKKATIRRELLRSAAIDIARLANIDVVDAALCALTAHHFLAGSIKTYGDPETGLIVVPASLRRPIDKPPALPGV